MSIRINFYDFFAYTLPGVFYLLIVGFWLDAFQFVEFDTDILNNVSFSLLIIVGAGYIIGLLINPIAYGWMRLFRSRNSDATKSAFDEFRKRHPWLDVKFNSTDWVVLLFVIKNNSIEVAMDVEQHNVAGIMLRNISLGFLSISIGCFTFFVVISANIWNLVFAAISLVLSSIALKRSSLRRDWFYIGVFEAFLAYYLTEGKLASENLLSVNRANSKVQESDASPSKSNSEAKLVSKS